MGRPAEAADTVDPTPDAAAASAACDDQDDIIEIDYDMITGAKAKRVKALHITERFMKTDLVPKRNDRELKKIFLDLQQLDATVETMHVDLDTTQITGAMLASAITSHLTALQVKSGLLLANQDDRVVLGKSIYEHEFLGEIRLHNLIARNRLLARWNKNPAPPLDVLVPAFTSIVFLNVLELSCSPEQEAAKVTVDSNPSTETIVPRPMLSLLGVKELCHSLTLQRLELSRLNLTDAHFGVLVEQLSQRSSTSCLTELILNENLNTESGLAMMASLLFKADCALEHLECYQSESVVMGSTVDLFEEALKTNTTLHTLRIHLWGEEEEIFEGESPRRSYQQGRIPHLLKLNRRGRKRLVNKRTSTSQWLDLMVDVKDDPDLFYYCLRNSRFWWTCRGLSMARPKDFVLRTTALVPESPLGNESSASRKKKRLDQLKERHSEALEGFNLNHDVKDDLSDIGEDQAVEESSISKELEAMNLPQFLSLNNSNSNHEDMHSSMISLGAESYIQDLLHQKEDRPEQAREEVLEEALEELDFAKTHDKIPPGMSDAFYFNRVLARLTKEKEKEEKVRERKLDSLLEATLIKEAAKEMAAKEEAAARKGGAATTNGKSKDGE